MGARPVPAPLEVRPQQDVRRLVQRRVFRRLRTAAVVRVVGIRKKGGDSTDKPYGIGSVGFPVRKLPVAEEAVSFSFRTRSVTTCATESPLSPYYNLRQA